MLSAPPARNCTVRQLSMRQPALPVLRCSFYSPHLSLIRSGSLRSVYHAFPLRKRFRLHKALFFCQKPQPLCSSGWTVLFLLSSPPVHRIYSLPLHRPLLFLFVPAAAECPAGSQDPKDLPVSGLFIRERTKAVQRQNDVNCAVRIRKCTHIPLPEGHIFQVQAVCLFQTSSGTRVPSS